jgi:hypothetical protein
MNAHNILLHQQLVLLTHEKYAYCVHMDADIKLQSDETHILTNTIYFQDLDGQSLLFQ